MRNLRRSTNDDCGVKRDKSRWDDRMVEALLQGRDPQEIDTHAPDAVNVLNTLAALRTFAVTCAPQPSSELAAIMGGSAALTPAPAGSTRVRRSSTRARFRAAVVLCTAGLTLATVATAANALPAGAQRTVASVLNALTPFEFPTPHAAESEPNPALTPATTPRTSPPALNKPEGPARGAVEGDGEDGQQDKRATPESPAASDEPSSEEPSSPGAASPTDGDQATPSDEPSSPASPAEQEPVADPAPERGSDPSSDSGSDPTP